MTRTWTTVIEEWDEDAQLWVFFSQQSIKPGEIERTDEEYLSACKLAFPSSRLRIQEA